MAGLQVSCPKCGKTLKLPDRSLLGRKGKCPKCRHAFLLMEPDAEDELSRTEALGDDPLDVDELYDELDQIEQRRLAGEPDEVQMEIAEPSIGTPQTGTGARWVPDAAQPGAGGMPAPQPPMMPPGYPYPIPSQMPMPGQPWAVPPGYQQVPYPMQPGMPYPMAPGYAPMPYGAPQYAPPPMMAPPQPMPAAPMFAPATSAPTKPAASDNPFAVFAEAEPVPSALPSEEEMLSATSRLKAKTKSKSKKSRQAKQKQLAAIIMVGLLVVGGIAFAILGGRSSNAGRTKSKAIAQNPDDLDEPTDEAPQWESPLPVSPTKGAPIDMILMPYGVSAVVHLRPAELWEKGSKREEFRYCWGPLGEWLEKQIKALCNHEPAQIEELTFGLIPGVVGEPVQVCGVVRLKDAAQKTALIKLFRELKAELKETDTSDYPVYESDKYAYVIKDLRTFAFCPRQKQTEMAESVNRANAQAPGLEAMLKKTDRLRQIVVLFDPTTLSAHAQFILPPELHRIADRTVEFFDPKQIETVVWSLHVGSEKFHSEILARNKSSIAKTAAQFELKKKLDKLPRELADTVRGYMDPKQLGPREIIGRFPAMTKVYALATHASTGDKYVSLATALPERAAPNLAIGALLTWDESTRTDFNKAASPTSAPKDTGKLPDLVADRLKLKLEVEFNRTPLQDAIKYIADECKVTIDIDGDGLKDAGFTKNMPQTMTLGKVTGLEGIAAICKKYEKEAKPLVLVIEEGKKRALITTKFFAEKGNLTPFPLP